MIPQMTRPPIRVVTIDAKFISMASPSLAVQLSHPIETKPMTALKPSRLYIVEQSDMMTDVA